MVQEHHVAGYDNLKEFLKTSKFASESVVNILLSGEKNANGISWCSDCNDSEPAINEAIENFAPADSVFIHVDVGDRTFWKDMKNPFRLDVSLGKPQVIPTLFRFGNPKKLEGVEQCPKIDLLQMFFEEDD